MPRVFGFRVHKSSVIRRRRTRALVENEPENGAASAMATAVDSAAAAVATVGGGVLHDAAADSIVAPLAVNVVGTGGLIGDGMDGGGGGGGGGVGDGGGGDGGSGGGGGGGGGSGVGDGEVNGIDCMVQDYMHDTMASDTHGHVQAHPQQATMGSADGSGALAQTEATSVPHAVPTQFAPLHGMAGWSSQTSVAPTQLGATMDAAEYGRRPIHVANPGMGGEGSPTSPKRHRV